MSDRLLVRPTLAGDDPMRGRVGSVVAGSLALLTVSALVGLHALEHLGTAAVGLNPSSDFQIMTWSLAWWPHAFARGMNPLQTPLLWPPAGFSTLWMTTIPFPALLALPVTVIAGPLAAYNVLMVIAVVAATAAAFLLCHEIAGKVGPALVGSVVFGLSPYMLGHTLSQHLDLTFVFPVPLLVLLGIRFSRGKTSARRYLAGSALLLVALLGTSFELFVELALVVAVAAPVCIAAAGAARRCCVRMFGLLGLAYLGCLPLLAAVALLALGGSRGTVTHAPSDYSVDLLNLVVPTPTALTGRLWGLRDLSRAFVGNIGEQDGYLGLPLIAIACLALRHLRGWGAWFAGAATAVAVAFSFGPTLTVGGHQVLSLPFALNRIPVVGAALPARMSIFASLGAACLATSWLARQGRIVPRAALGALVLVSIAPNFGAPRRLDYAWASSRAFGWSVDRVPRGFVADPRWPTIVPPGTTVLVLPTQDRTASMYWQVESGDRFALAVPETPFVPSALASSAAVAYLVSDVLPQFDGRRLAAGRLRAFLRSDHVGAVVTTAAARPIWRSVVAAATVTKPVSVGRARVFRVPPGLRPLVRVGESTRLRAGPRRVRAWIRFDGRHGRLFIRYLGRTSAISSRHGDAERPRLALGPRGAAAVVFTEWRGTGVLLRVGTWVAGRWRVRTLESNSADLVASGDGRSQRRRDRSLGVGRRCAPPPRSRSPRSGQTAAAGHAQARRRPRNARPAFHPRRNRSRVAGHRGDGVPTPSLGL